MQSKEKFEVLLGKFTQIQAKLLRSHPDHQRWVSEKLVQRRATLLIGPRGVGKTTYLLSLVKDKSDTLYISLDNPLLVDVHLFEFGDWLFNIGFQQLIFDEVHNLENWAQNLKSLYDSNTEKKIIASDSSSLVLKKGLGDLSRRFVNCNLPFLSFREYLWLKYGIEFSPIDWNNYLSHKGAAEINFILKQFTKHKLSVLKEFRIYLKEGYRPIFLEGDYSEKSIQIIDKIIYHDIPYFLPDLKERHIHLMRNVLSYLAESQIPRLIIESLSKRWAVSKTTVYNLIEVMKETSLIRVIQKEGSLKVRSRGEKIFFSDPTHYNVLLGNLGNLRESFFCAEMERINKKCFASDDETTGDFKVEGTLIEIGGESKKIKGAQVVIRDNIEAAEDAKVRPLWALGFCI